jgi:hypothetical protein
MTKNEIEGEIPEEAMQNIKENDANFKAAKQDIEKHFGENFNFVTIPSDAKIEEVNNDIKAKFAPKIVLVNHEKGLAVDTVCSNLALKYNMLYLSVYQLIKENITKKTEMGVKLLASKRVRPFNPKFGNQRDDFEEKTFSPVHYDLSIVTALIKKTICERLTNQKFVLVEGLCNNGKLGNEDDQMELRLMDEYFSLEQNVFQVGAVFSLLYEFEKEIPEEHKEDAEVKTQRLKELAEKEK